MTTMLKLPTQARPLDLPAAMLTAFVASQERTHHLSLLVDGVHCANCIRKIEARLAEDPSVLHARINLTLRRLNVDWTGEAAYAEQIGETVRALGYGIAPYEADSLSAAHMRTGRELLRCLAVAAFASSNVMMLAWAVWAGQAQGMPASTQALLNWLSAMVALPALAYAGRPFYRSAFSALRARRTNIDVPIVAGLLLTATISLFELLRQGPDVYFDSALMLLFVLLIGRYLDFRVRARSRDAIERLVMLKARHATIVDRDGGQHIVLASSVEPGMTVLVGPGETVPVDGRIQSEEAFLDNSAVTGETLPIAVRRGDDALAGAINGMHALRLEASRTAADSHLSDILRLVEQAQLQKGKAASLADGIAAVWTPVVHGIALVTFVAWWFGVGADLPTALLHAVSVLIIACPCAIGLAIPAVQVAAIGGLLRHGVMVRSGDALERLAGIDSVVFDKTGTLTTGRPEIVEAPGDLDLRRLAASLATGSQHPYARALSRYLGTGTPTLDVQETPGGGRSGLVDGLHARLGSAAFCGLDAASEDDDASEVWVSAPPHAPARFVLAEAIRPDADATIAYFRKAGIERSILSGDRTRAVAQCAAELGIAEYRAELAPAGKVTVLSERHETGHRVLMVGDGLNDAPALAQSYVSASFGHGAAATQVAADIILPAETLSALGVTHLTAVRAAGIIRQNLGFAAVYNAVLIPIAVFGHASPLIAAAAMSASSVIVTLNALRARPPRRERVA
ncbi:heavy metal translocating P-type ATPase [Bosea beijingensis]